MNSRERVQRALRREGLPDRVPLQFDCGGCGALFDPGGEDYVCPHCGSREVKVAAGDDMRVEYIDLEDSPDDLPDDATDSV